MRDPARIPEILRILGQLWTQPGTDQLRLGQLIHCAAHLGGFGDDDLFYCEDGVILEGFNEMLKEDNDA